MSKNQLTIMMLYSKIIQKCFKKIIYIKYIYIISNLGQLIIIKFYYIYYENNKYYFIYFFEIFSN